MVGATGFEPATSSSRTKRATKLRHAPNPNVRGTAASMPILVCSNHRSNESAEAARSTAPVWGRAPPQKLWPPANAVEAVIGDVDQVLVMTVNPGFGGQQFIAGTLAKVETLRGWIRDRELSVRLEVDGGITEDTIASAARAGANAFVAGTAIFGAPNYREAITALRQAASS